MVDTLVSGASASRRVGSTPIMRTRPVLLTGLFLCLYIGRIAESHYLYRM